MSVLEALLADPQGALTDVLLYHVVDGAVLAEGSLVELAGPVRFRRSVVVSVLLTCLVAGVVFGNILMYRRFQRRISEAALLHA